MKKQTILLLFTLIALFLLNNKVLAETEKNLVNIYFFHSDNCSHCKEEIALLEKLEKKYNNINLYKYEIHDNKTKDILKEVNNLYNLKTNVVPTTIIGNKVYMGFSYEKSSLNFTKTIEYYSRYGYNDKLGKYLKVDLPTYDIRDNDITLENFFNNYQNYNILGFKTDNLNPVNISLILGLLSSFNIVNIINIIIILFIMLKINNIKNKIIFTITFFILKIVLLLTILLNNIILTNIIYIAILLFLIFTIIKIIKKNREYIYLNMMIIISIISNYIILKLDNNIIILKEILNLHNLEGLTTISYYSNYLIINFIINSTIIYIGYSLLNQTINNNSLIKHTEEKNEKFE